MTLKQTSALIDVQLFKDKILGIGSFGKVYRARYGSLPCAAKVIHETLFDPRASKKRPQKEKHRQPFKRFKQECEVLHNLRHPNIIQYLDVYQDPETKLPVLLMELMDGSLTHFLEDSLQQIPLHIQVNFTHDVALALSFLHANKIVHRDLSSNNILLISNVRAKVTDFGMAMLQEATQSTRTVRPGTNVYMPPEAVQDNPIYTEKIDCFSLGVIIIQILTLCFPAPSDRQEELETLPGRLQKGRKIMTTVPEVERRKNHIDLVQPNHPLLTIALNCLQDIESNRPSAQEICEMVATLKESAEYTESAKEGDKEEKHHNINDTSSWGQEADSDEIRRLKELICLKDETLAAKEREIEDLRKQVEDNTESPQQWEKPPQDTEGPKKEYSNYLTEEDFKEDHEMEQLGEFPEGVTAIIKVQKPHQEEGHSKLEVFTDKPWYHGVLSQQEAEKRMEEMDMNTFLVRESVQDKGNLFLSVKNGDKCYHFPIIDHGSGLKRYEIHGTSVLFPSVPELVKYYQQHGLPESTDGKLIHLIRACSSGATPQPARPRKQHDYNSIDDYEDGDSNNEPVVPIRDMPWYWGNISRDVAMRNAGVHNLGGGLRDGVYDIAETNEAEICDDAASIEPQQSSQVPILPKFDDVIYMKQGETPFPPLIHPKPATPSMPHSGSAGVKSPHARKPVALRNIKALSMALPEPPAPLQRQKYFHGSISRMEAEALLEKDGQFLIRESSKRPGQYVLTGMAKGQPQHLLLIDKEGRVKSRDRVFESVPHLVACFSEKRVPLVIGCSVEVYLNDCIVSISSYRSANDD